MASTAAAALADRSVPETVRLLDQLAAAHLVDRPAPDRYSCHDLLRRYAAKRAADEDTEADRDEAVSRLFDHYLHTANAAADQLYPYLVRLPQAADALPHKGFPDPAAASAWLDAERPNLLAAVQHANRHGPKPIAWLLADTLRGYFYLRREFVDWFTLANTALAAVDPRQQPQAAAAAHFSLGTAHYGRNQYATAVEH
jgi:hypothetical protein